MIKDWRDAGHYPNSKGFYRGEGSPGDRRCCWGWEFLRRNRSYQADWEAKLRAYLQWKESGSPDAEPGVPPYDELTSADPMDRGFHLSGLWELGKEAAERWGLPYCYVNPQQDRPAWLLRIPAVASLTYGPEMARPLNERIRQRLQPLNDRLVSEGQPPIAPPPADPVVTIHQGQAAIKFDLSRPLQPQLRVAKALLMVGQRRYREAGLIPDRPFPRAHPSLWPIYLRILDAVAVGVSLGEIAAQLFPELPNDYPECQATKKADAMHRQARRLVEGGYRDLGFEFKRRV